MAEIPKGIGKGEGGGKLPKLEAILREYEQRLSNAENTIADLEQRVATLEGGTGA